MRRRKSEGRGEGTYGDSDVDSEALDTELIAEGGQAGDYGREGSSDEDGVLQGESLAVDCEAGQAGGGGEGYIDGISVGWAEDTGAAVGCQVRGGFERGTGNPAVTAFEKDTDLESEIGSGSSRGVPTIEIAERVSKLRCPCTIFCEFSLVRSILEGVDLLLWSRRESKCHPN